MRVLRACAVGPGLLANIIAIRVSNTRLQWVGTSGRPGWRKPCRGTQVPKCAAGAVYFIITPACVCVCVCLFVCIHEVGDTGQCLPRTTQGGRYCKHTFGASGQQMYVLLCLHCAAGLFNTLYHRIKLSYLPCTIPWYTHGRGGFNHWLDTSITMFYCTVQCQGG